MKTFTIFFFSFSLFAQTAQYPNSIAGQQHLGTVANGVSGTLNNSMTTGSTSANITNGTCTLGGQATTCSVAFKPYMFVTIQNEIAQICSIGSSTGVAILNFGILGSACPSISGRGLDNTQIAAHTTPSFPNKITISNNITAWPHMADSAEITAIETNTIGSVYSVRGFGAKCDGTDETTIVQAAIDATKGGTLNLCDTGTLGLTMPYFTLYPANDGITINGLNAKSTGTVGGGFKAIDANTTSGSMVTILAEGVHFNNVLFDCNNKAAFGLTSSMGFEAKIVNSGSQNCNSHGTLINLNANIPTAITLGGGFGSTAVTVTSITNNRLTFGSSDDHCTNVTFDPGLSTQQSVQITSVAGLVLHITPSLNGTKTSATCHGNSNKMKLINLFGANNGGCGLYIQQDTDTNAFHIDHPNMSGNLCGELIRGSAHVHTGGSFANNTNAAVQLGDTTDTGSSASAGSWFSPLGDVEGNGFNGVSSVCDNTSTVQYANPTTFRITTGVNACAGNSAGSSTIGYGVSTDDSAGVPCLAVTTAYGTNYYGLGGCPLIASGTLTISKVPNLAVECTGVGTPDASCPGASANNALVVALRDTNGNLVTSSDFTPVICCVGGLGHTLRIGANSINYNNIGVEPIGSHIHYGSSLTIAYDATGGYIKLVRRGAIFTDESQ